MSAYIFPKPRDWETLEDLTSEVFSYELGNSNLQRYGRRGQAQHGVDVAGMEAKGVVIGIQCKHIAERDITKKEIDEEIKKAEGFSPPLSRYIIITSAKRHQAIISHILKLNIKRRKRESFPVEIFFWDNLEKLIEKYPDILFSYFTKYLPTGKPEYVIAPDAQKIDKDTLSFPVEAEALKKKIAESMQMKKVEPYNISFGITSFESTSFSGRVDLQLKLDHLFSDSGNPALNLLKAAAALNKMKEIVSDPFFSKNLTLHLNARLSLAFLVGWVFRKVTSHNLTLISGDQIWATNGLPVVPSDMTDSLPVINSEGNQEAVVILNVSRDISEGVKEFVSGWSQNPSAILSFSVEGGKIRNAAHALSVATDIARKLKNLKDQWGIKRIQFFGAIPASLATLIAYHLNSICPINIYFMDQAEGKYVLGGEINNKL